MIMKVKNNRVISFLSTTSAIDLQGDITDETLLLETQGKSNMRGKLLEKI